MSNYGYILDQKEKKRPSTKKQTERIYFPITNIGSVTLMMIFIVVCMVSFAALSLSTAASDYRAAKKSATHVTDYYEASNKAEEKLEELEKIFSETYETSSDQDNYYQTLKEKLQAMDDITVGEDVSVSSGITISYDCNISKKQALHVELLCGYPQGSTDTVLYQITSWQTISTTQWEGDNSIKLIGQ